MIPRDAYLDSAPLQPGDTVAFVSPAGQCSAEALERGKQFYEQWGLNVLVGEHALAKHPRADYLAGTDAERRADLVAAWLNPDIDAVVSTRGGYGSLRLLDGIDWAAMRAAAARRDGRPKLLTGSSDITALHEAFRAHLDVPTLFCPMATNDVFGKSTSIRDDVHRWLFQAWRGQSLVGPATEVLAPGIAAGRFTGGNLSLLASALGAAEAERQPDGILFLEDVTEKPYRIDNFLTQLRRAGSFDSVKGVVLGSWHECGDLDAVRALMEEEFGESGIPVLWEQGFGHDPDAISVPLGVEGLLDATGQEPVLTVTEGV